MHRRGLTIVELLVVLGIVAILLGLMLPALQQAQQDARMAGCKNNLKQIAIGLHNYHDTYNCFPPGFVSKESHAGSGRRYGWQASLSPFLDQAPLFNQLNFSAPPADPRHTALAKSVIPVLRCPADRTPATNPLRGDLGTSNYPGNNGPTSFPRWAPLGGSDFWPGTVESPMRTDGLFARNTRVGLRDITDGSSNTVMVLERSFSSGAAIWIGVTDVSHEEDTLVDMSHSSRPNASRSSSSSQHKGGVNLVMCDGAVKFIANSIQSTPVSAPGGQIGLWQRLSHKSDGLPLSEF